jgi:hypothetical protein
MDGRMIEVRFPAGAGNFSHRRHVKVGTGTHPASYPMGTRGSLPGGKAAVKLTTNLLLVLRSKNVWSYTSAPQYAFMEWSLVKHRDNFTFYFHLYFWRLRGAGRAQSV